VVVSYRTLHRYATTELGFGQRKTTVRVADGEPTAEVQVDFGRRGLLTDQADGRRRGGARFDHRGVFAAHVRLADVLTDPQRGDRRVRGRVGVLRRGVFAVVIPDNMKAILQKADAFDPKLNDAFREYAQARGFAVAPAPIRSPRAKGLAS
jgi:hypothetical protein